ncbi:hypothetical protein CDL15_Pgr020204 [Punica granatum]|uniref:Calmodulin-binding protein 60 A-like n=1 Tax=Punica granatum TaxID=22663 RepID=A0A218VS50_PUNGR|nr:hypothetical protein CDL15_Pgr020204 [Punica granatum]PKI47321.1 hypothetical protein CRG98_032296 [Punica granatum]
MKRYFQEEGGEGFGVEDRDSKIRRFTLNSLKNVIGGWSTGDIICRLEPFLRSVIRDEVDRAITNFHDRPTERSLLNTVGTSEVERGLELRFIGNLASTIFTGSKIVAEDGNTIRLELFDARTNRIVAMGPLSSIKIEILVLDGDFGCDGREDWTEKDFSANIIREREGKRPLLNGEHFIILRGGVGYLAELAFTDNSSWVRSRKFRLGARTVQKIPTEVRIKEARSETFVVKDHRGELYKKHHPPHLLDEVWRLEKISRDGTFHKRLTSHGIQTVKDFLRLYETDPSALKNILSSGIPSKTWESIIEHANNCVVDDNNFYGYNQTLKKQGLLFNSVYKVVAATFDGQFYSPLDKLTSHQKVLVQNMKKQAFNNLHHLFPIDALSTIAPPRSLSNFQMEPSLPGTNPLLQPLEFPVQHQGQVENTQGLSHCSPSISFSSGAPDAQSFNFATSSHNNHLQVQVLNTTSGNSCITGEFWSGENNVLPNDSPGPLSTLNNHSAEDENIFQVQTPSWFL